MTDLYNQKPLLGSRRQPVVYLKATLLLKPDCKPYNVLPCSKVHSITILYISQDVVLPPSIGLVVLRSFYWAIFACCLKTSRKDRTLAEAECRHQVLGEGGKYIGRTLGRCCLLVPMRPAQFTYLLPCRFTIEVYWSRLFSTSIQHMTMKHQAEGHGGASVNWRERTIVLFQMMFYIVF